MLNYVGFIIDGFKRVSDQVDVARWLIAPFVPLAYSLPVAAYRTKKSEISHRGESTIGRDYRPDGEAFRTGNVENIILKMRHVSPDVSKDQSVVQAHLTVQKAKHVEQQQIAFLQGR